MMYRVKGFLVIKKNKGWVRVIPSDVSKPGKFSVFLILKFYFLLLQLQRLSHKTNLCIEAFLKAKLIDVSLLDKAILCI